ncbi:MAG: DUF429 domain-containing protein [Verrucomicrobiaceae bacterium]|nr:MAG: DUF429 domain-containing protein [Verrucomicrobiaceae bacterium]
MITLGIDLSSNAANTAVCWIDWPDQGPPTIHDPEVGCDDARLDEAIEKAEVVGIDAPFGWPECFRAAVAEWGHPQWTDDEDLRLSLRFRRTDLAIQKATGLWPLSVSSDRIALPAMRAMALLLRHRCVDRSGDGRFYEVYPAASLKRWGFPHSGYKNTSDEANAVRRAIRDEIQNSFPSVPPSYANNDHALDALIASLTARAAALGLTLPPGETQGELGRGEGWIHLPQPGSLIQLTGTLKIP